MASTKDMNWEALAEQKRNSLLQSIPAKWHLPTSTLADLPSDLTGTVIQSFLSPQEVEITETPAAALLPKLAAGTWSAVAVTTAFAHRAAVAHQLTNCLSEFFFDAALASARALDAHLASHAGEPVGALHGLPVSLKDSVDVAGVQTTLGFVSWLTAPPVAEDAVLAAGLRRAGAVLFAKTAVPQASFAAETFNAVAGYVPNPLRHGGAPPSTTTAAAALSAGGSSGGESALLALKGSPLGFGTDIGGSIRWPAASVGGYGLRPSTGRLPYAGIASVVGALESVTDVKFAVGPMTVGDVRGLGLAVRALLGDEPWTRDPLVVEMPWREDLYASIKGRAEKGEKLVFGVAKWDGVVVPQPNVTRAVETVEAILKKAGHQVVPFEPPHPEKASELWSAAAYANLSHAHAQFAASGEPIDPRMPPAYNPAKNIPPLSTAEVQDLNVQIRTYRQDYLRYWMKGTAASSAAAASSSSTTTTTTTIGRPAVDALIMPIAPYAAARIGGIRWSGYPTPVVLNDHSAAVLPVLRTDKNVDVKGPAPPQASEGRYAKVNKAVYDDYDPALYDGMPVNVQIIGRRYQEEQVLAITEYVDGLIRGQKTNGHRL